MGMATVIGFGTIAMVPVSAADTSLDPQTGDTKVSYTNENIVNPSGSWLGVIPTNVALSKSEKTKNIEIELRAGEGFDLATDYNAAFKVDVTAVSANGFTMEQTGKTALPYSMTIKDQTWDKDNVNKTVELNPAAAKLTGNFTTLGTNEEGRFEDTITFTFTPTGPVFK